MFSFDPSPQEQEMIELINRMRLHPQQELAKLVQVNSTLTSTDPDVANALSFFNVNATSLQQQWSQLRAVPPLAWNEALANSARTHNELMIQYDTQSHNLPGEPSLVDRFRAEGYGLISEAGGSFAPAESVYAYGTGVFQTHAAFAIDWGSTPLDQTGDGIQDPPGHRDAIMRRDFREVGISYITENDDNTNVGTELTTVHFGAWSDASRPELDDPYLLGVAYSDTNADGNYSAGEGLSAVNVRITAPDGTTTTTTSASAGGWQQRVSQPGMYVVTFEGGALAAPVTRVTQVSADNVKIDLDTSDTFVQSFYQAADGWVYVQGTGGNDLITFGQSGPDLSVYVNSLTGYIPLDRVAGIQVNSYSGNDYVAIDAPITLGSRLYTGTGNDTVYGGSGDDLVAAKSGDDRVYGGIGNDTLATGRGDDLIGGGQGDDYLFGGLGNDTLYGGSGDDVFDSFDATYADVLVGGNGDDQAKIDTLDISDCEYPLA